MKGAIMTNKLLAAVGTVFMGIWTAFAVSDITSDVRTDNAAWHTATFYTDADAKLGDCAAAIDGQMTTSYKYGGGGKNVTNYRFVYEINASFKPGLPIRVTQYALAATSNNWIPKSWNFEGYDEEQGRWVLIDAQDGQTFTTETFNTYSCPENKGNYRKYRLVLRENTNINWFNPCEFAVYGFYNDGSAIDDATQALQVVPFDGNPHGPNVTVIWPESGYQVYYSSTGSGSDWTTDVSAFLHSEPGTYKTYYKITADGYADKLGETTVKIMPSTYYLDASAPDGGSGTEESPFNKISDVRDMLFDGLTVRFAAGTYPIAQEFDVRGLKSLVFTGPESGEAVITADVGAGARFLVGDKDASDITVRNLTFRNLHVDSPDGGAASCGGVFYLDGTQNLVVRDCVFDGCKAAATSANACGGVAYQCNASSSYFEDCLFTNNQAVATTGKGQGGCLYLEANANNYATCTNCTFTGNFAPSDGAVAYRNQAMLVFSKCRLTRNAGGNATVSMTAGTGWAAVSGFWDCLLMDNLTPYGVSQSMSNIQAVRTIAGGHLADFYTSRGGNYYGNDNILVKRDDSNYEPWVNFGSIVVRTPLVFGADYATNVPPAVINVPGDRATLTAALAEAWDGVEIRLAAGTYSAATGETFPLALSNKRNIRLVGAGVGKTVIDASGTADAALFQATNTCGLTVQDLSFRGASTSGSAIERAPFFFAADSARFTFERVAVTGLSRACGNGKTYGGLIGWNDIRALSFAECEIAGNEVTGASTLYGGVFYMNGTGEVTFDRCRITDNVLGGTTVNGGIVSGEGSAANYVTFRSSLVFNNAPPKGTDPTCSKFAGFLNTRAGTFYIDNCTIVSNGPALFVGHTGSSYFKNCIIGGHSKNALYRPTDNTYNTVQFIGTNFVEAVEDVPYGQYGTAPNGEEMKCFRTDLAGDCYPHFVKDIGFRRGGFELKRDSRCVDAGQKLGWQSERSLDLLGNARLIAVRTRRVPLPDCGCCECNIRPGLMLMVW